MKLNNHLIVTIPDFIRNFSFNEFWVNRKQFVRDMHPDKVYYWDNSLENAFYTIKKWITNENEKKDSNLRESGLHALNLLLGGNLDLNSISISNGNNVNISSEIIAIESGQNVDFPGFSGEKATNNILKLHKIEVHGKSSSPAKISINGNFVRNISVGDVAYITELNGEYIEILPTNLRNNFYELNLFCQDGMFRSTLVVQNLRSGIKKMYDGVISFALVDDGYIYIDEGGKPIYMTPQIPKFMLKHEAKAFYVKAHNEGVLVLYSDGVLKTTLDMDSTPNVYYSDFDINGKLIKKHRV